MPKPITIRRVPKWGARNSIRCLAAPQPPGATIRHEAARRLVDLLRDPCSVVEHLTLNRIPRAAIAGRAWSSVTDVDRGRHAATNQYLSATGASGPPGSSR